MPEKTKFDHLDFDNAMQVWGSLINSHYPAMLKYATERAKNIDDAKDIVGDVILKALENPDKFQDGTNLEAWLITMVKNNHLNKVNRKEKKTTNITDDFTRIRKTDTSRNADACFFDADFDKAYDALTEVERGVVNLLNSSELNYKEIAKALGIKDENKIYTHISKIRAKMKKHLPGYDLRGQQEPDILE